MRRDEAVKHTAELRRIAGFGVVGFAAFLTYLAAAALVIEAGGHPVIGAAAGFAAGTSVSFVGNCRWVFKVAPSAMVGTRFLLTTLAGLMANIGLAWFLARLGVHYVLTTIAVFTLIPGLNYLGHRTWTFVRPEPAASRRHDG